MKNTIKILIALGLLIISLLMSFKIYSLLTDSRVINDKIILKSGEIKYEITGSLKTNIHPAVNIINKNDNIKFKSKTKFDTKLRVTFKFYVDDEEVEYEKIIELLEVKSSWEFNEEDELYYYNGVVEFNDEIEILETLILDGNYVKSEFSNKKFKIEFILEAMQADHGAVWDYLEQE